MSRYNKPKFYDLINQRRAIVEQTNQRTAEAIQEEYKALCGELGQLQFQIEVLKGRLEQGNHRILALSKELDALNKLTTTEPKEVSNEQTK